MKKIQIMSLTKITLSITQRLSKRNEHKIKI